MSHSTISSSTVHHIAQLANLTVTPDEEAKFAKAFEETLTVVDRLQSVDVQGVEPTHQVTGLTNVLREDVVDPSRMFTQEQALANAKRTHNGFFVVEQLIDQE